MLICHLGRETCRLRGRSGGQQTNWSGEKEEQSWSGCQAFPGTLIITCLLRNVDDVILRWCVSKMPTCNECSAPSPGEKPHVAVCKLPGWESHFWLSDQREYDSAGEKLWVDLFSQWQVYQTGTKGQKKLTLHSWLNTFRWYIYKFLSFIGHNLWDCGKYHELGEI